ncbi:hypothetical protein FUAX_46790 (plasmid) [Fulvitalea axinellae]|uniref:SusD-like N-terminal domain-containing protein n=1 Tax=Fulvitalea axinellae TaxID=1182444 RepID=A0AAU9D3Y8_9BACT|nr:hypothetical protein FUAX_46790 [Fulvitalea axinellae]
MKKIKYIITGMLLAGLGACSSFLDEVPDNRVEINDLDKAAELTASAYSQGAYLFTEWMSDNADRVQGIGIEDVVDDAYRWQDGSTDGQDSPEYFWNQTYTAIAHANEVLAVIDNLPGNEEKRNAIRGEALVTRAYHHFLLVSIFAKTYNSQTSASDLGIPYVTEPERELIKNYDRGTVAGVYEKISQDLEEGIPLIRDEFYKGTGKYHFTAAAAHAFASRFYLFMGDLAKSVQHANTVLGQDPSSMIRDYPKIIDDQQGGTHLTQLYTSPDEPANLLLVYKHTVYLYQSRHGYGLSTPLFNDIFLGGGPTGGTDSRLELYFSLASGAGVRFPKYEYLFEKENLASETGLPTTAQVELRGEEVVFNRMEAMSHITGITKDTVYLAVAVNDMNAFIAKRYKGAGKLAISDLWNTVIADEGFEPDYIPTAADTAKLNGEMANLMLGLTIGEKRKEFVQEGQRWWDVLRYGIPVSHNTAVSGEAPLVLAPDDPRRVVQIPKPATALGLPANPR